MASMRKLAIGLSVVFLGALGCSSNTSSAGAISLTWELRDANTSQPLNCAAGEQVRVTAGGVADVFSCDALSGLTGPIPPGAYTVAFDLVDANGTVESHVT